MLRLLILQSFNRVVNDLLACDNIIMSGNWICLINKGVIVKSKILKKLLLFERRLSIIKFRKIY